jgi:hypothetical protein
LPVFFLSSSLLFFLKEKMDKFSGSLPRPPRLLLQRRVNSKKNNLLKSRAKKTHVLLQGRHLQRVDCEVSGLGFFFLAFFLFVFVAVLRSRVRRRGGGILVFFASRTTG